MMFCFHLLFIDLLFIQRPPGINDVCQYKRNKQRDPAHGNQGIVTRGCIFDGQRTLQIVG